MSAPQANAKKPVTITLPDGSTKAFDGPVTGVEIAESIGPGLAKAALAMKVNGKELDIYLTIDHDAAVEFLTPSSEDGLELIRHDAAHLMAQAVKELFPETQVTIGPAIENGFYYDFAREKPFSTDDLAVIEKKMKELSDKAIPVKREVWERDEAVKFFEGQGEKYKAEIIAGLPTDEEVSIYRQGDFLDLCRGPHAPATSHVKHFKLMKVAGAYWRGDSRNEMLQRIYGTAWATKDQLKQYLHMLEEAEKRDHRKLGREMDLFHLQEEAQGSVFWHPNGYTIWLQLESYIRRRLRDADYREVKTPQLMARKFWEQSGHWSKFRENMFIVPDEIPSVEEGHPVVSADAELMAIKPMNCPAHVQIFKQGIKSYRDLPLRMAEFGCCHRNEPHGALHGLMRVRQMTQDDAHIFCREDQIEAETLAFTNLLYSVYKDLGFENIAIRLATRPETRAGEDATWEHAEQSLAAALTAAGHAFEWAPGEGAFYGPKIEFHLKDAIGRSWQCGTLQLDFVLPERLDAAYIGQDGAKHRPVMLHRAILGSLERFIGILIEHYSGRFPLWLSPVQVAVTTITNEVDDYAREVFDALQAAGFRAVFDNSSNKINYKIREHSNNKVPVILTVGARERDERTVAVRRLGAQGQKVQPLAECLDDLLEESAPPA